MNVKKCLSLLLTALLTAAVFTACGKWDYSREAMKAANDAQGETLRVEFKVNQTFTNALRAAAEDNIQPADVDKAMTMDKSIEKLLTSGYRLDVYALRADVDADKAAAQLADEFVNRLAGCEDEGYISMVKADNNYFYMAVLTYKHGGSGSGSGGGSGSGDEGGSEEPGKPVMPQFAVQWYEEAADGYAAGTLVFRKGDDGKTAAEAMGNKTELNTTYTKTGLQAQVDWLNEHDSEHAFDLDSFNLKQVVHLVVEEGSGVKTLRSSEQADQAFGYTSSVKKTNTTLQSIELSSEITEIEDLAFGYCTNLSQITLSAEKIGASAFIGCSALKEVNLNGVEFVNESAFKDCTNLNSVTIKSNGDLRIRHQAFSGCSSLTNVTLDGNDITLDGSEYEFLPPMGVFQNCTTLSSVTLKGTLKEIGKDTFLNADWTNSSTTPNSTVQIYCTGGLGAFKDACPDKDPNTVGLNDWNQVHDISELNN